MQAAILGRHAAITPCVATPTLSDYGEIFALMAPVDAQEANERSAPARASVKAVGNIMQTDP